MRRTSRVLLTIMATLWVVALGEKPAHPANELCPMGGLMVRTATIKAKALAWARQQPHVAVDGVDSDTWTVLALSRTDSDIAMLIGKEYVFFGVAGRGGEVYPQQMEKAFGKDLGKLKETVKQEMKRLSLAGVIMIEDGDVQKISEALGRGLLEKSGRDWVLKSSACQAVDLPASGL